MNIIKLFRNVSLKYYKVHIPYIICLLMPVMLCAMVIYNLINFQISSKMKEYTSSLETAGNYDFLVYDISQDDINSLSSSDNISKIGVLTRITSVYSSQNADTETIVGCADKNAVEMLPLKITGKYPLSDNEILTTKEFLEICGVEPIVGVSVPLYYYSEQENQLVLKKDNFIVSGIYEKYKVSYEKKYKRFNYGDNGEDGTFGGYPEVYITASLAKKIPDVNYSEFNNAVMFDARTRSGYDDSNIYTEMLDNTGEFGFLNKYILTHRNHNKYKVRSALLNGIVIGFATNDIDGANVNGYNNVMKRAESGESYQSFIVVILIPLITVILLLITAVSVASMIRIGIIQRKPRFDTFKTLGMSTTQLMLCISVEMIIVSVLGTVLGLLFGDAVYRIILKIMGNGFIHVSQVDEIVKKVMPVSKPYIALLILFTIISGMISAWNVLKKMSLSNPKIKYRKLSIRSFPLMIQLRKRRNRTMRTNQFLELFIMTMVSITAIVSYCYFMIENSGESFVQTEYPLGNYYAEKDFGRTIAGGMIENNHEFGIPIDLYTKLSENEVVDDTYCSIINASSRLCYNDSSEINQRLKSVYTDFTIKSTLDRDDDIPDQPGVYSSITRIFSKVGFSTSEYTHSTPMIGLTDEYLEKLKIHVLDGEINLEKIKKGEEVILLQPTLFQGSPQSYKINLTDFFSVGDVLPLTDIIFSGDAEISTEMFFSTQGYRDALTNGNRTDIPVKVGAIVSLEDAPDLYRIINFENVEGKYPLFNIICCNDTFTALGLPDRNISRMYFQVNDKADIDAFNNEWEIAIAKCRYIKSGSSYDILKSVSEQKSLSLKKFSILFSVLLLTGAFSLVTAVWQQCESEKERLSELYKLGASKLNLFIYHIFDRIVYIFISLLISVMSVGILQLLYDSFLEKKYELLEIDPSLSNPEFVDKAFIFWNDILILNGREFGRWFRFNILVVPVTLLIIVFALLVFSVIVRYVRKANK